jgi:phenylacetate-CoA ligase
MRKVFWNKKIQAMSAEELKRFQLKLLRREVSFACRNSRFYRRKFEAHKVNDLQIKSLEDLRKFPFTTREELERNFMDILSVPSSKVATVRMTSGTTGLPMAIAHTKKDVDNVAEASARKLTYHGVTSKDVVQITAAYGLWQGAWSAHWGAEKIGACILPVGAGDTERQIRIIRQFKTTVLYGVTNYHFRIAEVAKKLGESLRDYNLRIGICVAEKPSEKQMEVLKEEFGYKNVAIDYGATEFPGFSVHCEEDRDFHHVWADYYLIEVVDPKTHEPLEKGEKGELAITSLQREAFPLIRYLSRDITRYVGFENCECGMSHPKIDVNIDREDFMTKIRGTAVFPSQIECILNDFPELTGRCQIIIDKRTPKQEAVLKVEANKELVEATLDSLKKEVVSEIKNRIGVTFNEVVFVPLGTFSDKYAKASVVS